MTETALNASGRPATRILFVTDLRALPQATGGVQSLMHELAQELAARGRRPAVLAPFAHDDRLGLRNRVLMKISGAKTIRDRTMGYDTWRRWSLDGDLAEPLARIRPDVAIVMPTRAVALAKAVSAHGVPTLFYVQDAELQHLGGDPRDLVGVRFAANSEFTARLYRDAFGIDAVVIPPLIRPERYRTATTRANVTLINPHPLKGGELAVAIARRLPEIPFVFVQAWSLPPDYARWLNAEVATLSNVTLRPKTDDMKSVYREAKVLLAPSRWQEAWGRVASEAQFSGIPVVASDRGGLPEAVGAGGVLLDPDGPVEAWVDAIQALWTDARRYAALSEAALTHSRRPQIAPTTLVDSLLRVLGETVAAHGSHDADQRSLSAGVQLCEAKKRCADS